MYLTIKLDPAGSWRVHLMMYLTNKVYHRRALSYWFHIICNSLYLPSRPFSSPLCFMWLCPFLIIVTDRRSAEKDGENERESRDFVTAVFVCVNARSWVGVGVDIFPIGRDLYPRPPILSTLYLMLRDVSSKARMGGLTEIRSKQPQLIQTFFQWMSVVEPQLISTQTHTHTFLLVCASTTQMARVSVITVDNGCGSPLTSATTGNVDTQTHTHTMHVHAKLNFSNEWKPGRIIIPGQGVKQPAEV